MLEIKEFDTANLKEAWKLWNKEAEENIYSPLSLIDFEHKFFLSRSDVDIFVYQAVFECEFAGFIIGDIKKEYLNGEDYFNTPGYIVFVLVKKEFRKQGIGSKLLETLIEQFKNLKKTNIVISYRNPLTLEWHVPKKKNIVHNNAPGVPCRSDGYDFFLKNGFISQRIEDGLFLSLNDFILPDSFFEKKDKLSILDIDITMYDAALHYGFDELFDALGGEVWRKTINDNAKRNAPLPVLVASKCGKIVGFAGPIDKEENGRGWFNGIATHPDFERNGIAFVLFCSLMMEFKKIGASFSTIFTDEDNPALILYKRVCFEVGCKFSLMNKEI